MQTIIIGDCKLSTEVMTASQLSSFIDYTYQKKEYTAIEVLPTSRIISAGTIDSFTGLEYAVDVPVCDTLVLHMYCKSTKADSDIVIDFGDGTVVKFSEYLFSLPREFYSDTGLGYYQAKILHTYESSYLDKKSIVKIYGRDYFMLRGYDTAYPSYPNIVSRIMESDLPIASNLKNVSSLCNNSMRVLRFQPMYGFDSRIVNWSYLFLDCKNLQIVEAGDYALQLGGSYTANGVFQNCENLKISDMRIPFQVYTGDCSFFYCNCSKLSADINDLLPANGFTGTELRMISSFYNCSSIYGHVPAEKLWNDPSKYFKLKYNNRGLLVLDELPQLPEYAITRIARDLLVYDELPTLPYDAVNKVTSLPPIESQTDENVGKLYYLTSPSGSYAQYSLYVLEKTSTSYRYDYVLNSEYEAAFQKSDQKIYKAKVGNDNKLYYATTYSDTHVYKIQIANFFVDEHPEHPIFHIYSVDNEGQMSSIQDLTEYASKNIVLTSNKLAYVELDSQSGHMAFKNSNYKGSTFSGCSDAIRSQCPEIFGGTAVLSSNNLVRSMFANMAFNKNDANTVDAISEQLQQLITIMGGNLN